MISVLLIDDSGSERDRLSGVLGADPMIEVVATADRGTGLVELAAAHDPDVVVLEWEMRSKDGLVATRTLMEVDPRPVVLCSEAWRADDFESLARVHEAGAVAAVRKPGSSEASDYQAQCLDLVRSVRLSAGVKVVRRWRRDDNGKARPDGGAGGSSGRPVRVVAIGASTGGPPVLESIVSKLPADFPAPVLIVQHIAEGFVNGLIDWLMRVTSLHVQLAVHGERACAGHVYLAPDGKHLGIDPSGCLVLDDSPPESSQRPAVSYLFRSVARSFGGNSAGVLLTGMGSDGAAELKALRDLQAVTVAQDEGSCTVFGMPGEAIKIGAAQHVLPPDDIGELLCRVSAPSGVATPDSASVPPRSDS